VVPLGIVVVVELTGTVVVVEIGRVVGVVVDVVAGCGVGVVTTGMKVPGMPPLVAGDPVVGPFGG
jgi:hypothetical protein